MPNWKRTLRRVSTALGPGLTTGAADDDPSGIATYSQTGAQFGFALTWTMFLTLPFMAAIQVISACIGWQTRSGLARNIARRLPPFALFSLVALLVIANTINIAADLAAMAEALRLVIGGPAVFYALAFGFACLIAEVFVPYHHYAGYLKFLTLVLFVYVAAAFTVQVPWHTVIISTFVPGLSLDRDLLLMIVAVFGTTISPYLFFWQASQEAEESRLSHRRKYAARFKSRENYFTHISIDTWVGMFVSNFIAFFIMLENRKRIGELSEAFALKWERERLLGAGHKKLARLIKDCRNTPGCGYDFLSYTEPGKERLIEVKSAGRIRTASGFRFFLSETEHKTSRTAHVRDSYCFYLVFFDPEGSPFELRAWKAEELYAISDLGPNGYVVSFDWENSD